MYISFYCVFYNVFYLKKRAKNVFLKYKTDVCLKSDTPGYPYYYKQDKTESVDFKDTVNEQNLVSYKALSVSNLSVKDKEDLL
jgi:hypothetical protein